MIESYSIEGATIYHCTHQELRSIVEPTDRDTVIVDAPYSDRTHDGSTPSTDLDSPRRSLDYASWSDRDVGDFCSAWAPCGWLVSLTDHTLMASWVAHAEARGRYAFAPVPCVTTGMSARFLGDGPPSWACYAMPSRPRSGEWLARWHEVRRAYGLAPRGAYITTTRDPRTESRIGGKHTSMMRMIISDYTAPGSLVIDPCAGMATTLIAAAQIGRRAVGSEPDEETYRLACERMRRRLSQRDLWREGMQAEEQR